MPLSKRKLNITFFSAFSALCILLIGGGFVLALNSYIDRIPIKKFFASDYKNAVWEWGNISSYDSKYNQENADYLYMHQINTVFVDLSGLVNLVGKPDNDEKNKLKDEQYKALENYIAAMSSHNIKVFATAGDPDWSKEDQQYIPLKFQEFVFEYNNTHKNKLAGIEYDIEAYNQSHFEKASMTEKGLVLTEYLDLVKKLADAQQKYINNSNNDKNLELGFAIPYWLDNENKNIQSVEWHNKSGPALFHLMDILNNLPASNVVVMAYRNAALGNDGAVFHSQTEVQYAQSAAKNVKVIIGVEVNDVEPAKITYFGQSQSELSNEVAKIYSEFKRTNSFSGIAINDLEGYKNMKP